jgi:hypothetical protein
MRAVAAGVGAAALARAAYGALRRRPPASEKTWQRTNHRGEPVTLLEGPAVTIGAVTAHVAVAALSGASADSRPAAVSGAGALAFGLLDDLAGSARRKGLRGHLGALSHGEITTGAVKLAGLAVTGFAAAAAIDRTASGDRGARGTAPSRIAGRAADLAVDAGLIAGVANLVNLFDLRPGRAIKVSVLAAGLIAAGGRCSAGSLGAGKGGAGQGSAGLGGAGLAAVAAPVGAALALLPEDLGERAMLGDAGANAIGAMLGAAAAQALPRGVRTGLLAGIVALTVASEKVSFTRVIERTPALRWFDMLGRRPASVSAPLSDGAYPVDPAYPGTPASFGPAGAAKQGGAVRSGAVRSWAVLSGAVRSETAGSDMSGGETARGTGASWFAPRRPGRHRRAGSGESRARSGSPFLELRRRPARRDP